MWSTPNGKRVLRGAEWELFRRGIAGVWHYVEDSLNGEQTFSSGSAAFDHLQPEQKLALLALVGKALSEENIPAPELTSHAEATVAAVFECIRQSIELEIDLTARAQTQKGTNWREQVVAAYRETAEESEESLPDASCQDLDEWDLLIDCLSDEILWDCDFDMDECFLDAEPPLVMEKLKEMGIGKEYFLKIAPDPTAEELDRARETLRELTR